MKLSILIVYIFFFSICLSSCFNKANFKDLEKAKTYYDEGIKYFLENNFDKSQALFELAYENGLYAKALDALGCIALKNGSIKEAKALFKDSITADSEYSLAYGHLAYILELQNKKNSAKKYYQKALALNPNDFRLRNNFSALLFDLYKNIDQKTALFIAESELNKAIIINKDNKQLIKNKKFLKGIKYE